MQSTLMPALQAASCVSYADMIASVAGDRSERQPEASRVAGQAWHLSSPVPGEKQTGSWTLCVIAASGFSTAAWAILPRGLDAMPTI